MYFLKITNVSGTRKGENQNVCDFSQNDTVFSFSFLSNLYTGDCIPKLIKKTNKQTRSKYDILFHFSSCLSITKENLIHMKAQFNVELFSLLMFDYFPIYFVDWNISYFTENCMKLDLITQTEEKVFTLYFTFRSDYFSENRLNHSWKSIWFWWKGG